MVNFLGVKLKWKHDFERNCNKIRGFGSLSSSWDGFWIFESSPKYWLIRRYVILLFGGMHHLEKFSQTLVFYAKKKDRKFANPFCLARIASDLTHSEGAALIQRCAKMHTCQKNTIENFLYSHNIQVSTIKLALASCGFKRHSTTCKRHFE